MFAKRSIIDVCLGPKYASVVAISKLFSGKNLFKVSEQEPKERPWSFFTRYFFILAYFICVKDFVSRGT